MCNSPALHKSSSICNTEMDMLQQYITVTLCRNRPQHFFSNTVLCLSFNDNHLIAPNTYFDTSTLTSTSCLVSKY